MTRVVAVIDSLGLGGAERLLVTLARHGPDVGIEPVVVTLRESSSPVVVDALRREGVPIVAVASPRRHHLADPVRWRRLVHTLRRLEPDVVHTHLGTAHVLGGTAAHHAGLPVVASIHNVRLGPRGARGRAEEAALRRADAVVAVGHEVARTHRAVLRHRPVVVVPNPVDPAVQRPSGDVAALRRRLTTLVGGPVLVAVGRLEAQKGYDVLLDAMRLAVDRRPSVALVIAGQGRLEPDLRRRAEALDLGRNVAFLGPRGDVPDLLAAADLFVNASHHEGLPLSVLEAMAAGLPVVATDVGDVGSVVGAAGLVVPPRDPVALADAITALLDDDGRRRRAAEHGRRIVADTYGPRRWVTALDDVYAPLRGTRAVRAP